MALVRDATIYQHPLAYLLALESADELGAGVHARPIDVTEGYGQWAPTYDAPGNRMIEREQPVVWGMLDALPVGVALDAACGTGRHSRHLDALGHRVIGVDLTEEMLAVARANVPAGEFRRASLEALPLGEESVDLVVCGLALSHRRVPRGRGEPSPPHVPGAPPDIWALNPYCVAATNAAWLGRPHVIVWRFELG